MTKEMAVALCDAGYVSVSEYLRLCAENGWSIDPPVDTGSEEK